jgi:hypothetical protein
MSKEEVERVKSAKVAKTKVGEESKNIYRAVLECNKDTGEPTRLDIHAIKVFADIEGTMISNLPSKTIFFSNLTPDQQTRMDRIVSSIVWLWENN